MCGYHRAVTGAALAGMVPEPDFLVASTCPCSAGLATIENLARHYRKDLFLLHVPQEETPANVAYLADQLRALVDFVVAHTGHPLDPAQLATAMDATNQMRALMAEIYQLAQTVPSPAAANDLRNFGIIMPLFFGTAHGVALAQAYRDEFARRVANGIAGMPEEKLRLLWVQNRVQFKSPLEALLSKSYGAAIVIDELNTINWEPMDPGDPYPGLASRIIRIPLNGTAKRRTAHLQQLAKDYRIDGAVNPCHWGCRQGTGIRGLVAESFKEIGVPVLNLEVDCIDPRPFSEGQLRTRVEAFVEVLTNRSISRG
jgi:benzoyl-CoA reductase/2-hydroxyglutaryl-CoA dehydratase subunit BcrC/BadD/HgdB